MSKRKKLSIEQPQRDIGDIFLDLVRCADVLKEQLWKLKLAASDLAGCDLTDWSDEYIDKYTCLALATVPRKIVHGEYPAEWTEEVYVSYEQLREEFGYKPSTPKRSTANAKRHPRRA